MLRSKYLIAALCSVTTELEYSSQFLFRCRVCCAFFTLFAFFPLGSSRCLYFIHKLKCYSAEFCIKAIIKLRALCFFTGSLHGNIFNIDNPVEIRDLVKKISDIMISYL